MTSLKLVAICCGDHRAGRPALDRGQQLRTRRQLSRLGSLGQLPRGPLSLRRPIPPAPTATRDLPPDRRPMTAQLRARSTVARAPPDPGEDLLPLRKREPPRRMIDPPARQRRLVHDLDTVVNDTPNSRAAARIVAPACTRAAIPARSCGNTHAYGPGRLPTRSPNRQHKNPACCIDQMNPPTCEVTFVRYHFHAKGVAASRRHSASRSGTRALRRPPRSRASPRP